jgi:hypothetical protein
MGLVKTDRSDIERQVRQADWMIRTWQDRRENIVEPNLRWRQRADVIAV